MANPTQASIDYLHNVKIITENYGSGVFATNSHHAHRRPILPLPELFSPDTPENRVVTVNESERIPYYPPFRVFDDELTNDLPSCGCCG